MRWVSSEDFHDVQLKISSKSVVFLPKYRTSLWFRDRLRRSGSWPMRLRPAARCDSLTAAPRDVVSSATRSILRIQKKITRLNSSSLNKPGKASPARFGARTLRSDVAAIEHRRYQSAYEIAARLDRLPRWRIQPARSNARITSAPEQTGSRLMRPTRLQLQPPEFRLEAPARGAFQAMPRSLRGCSRALLRGCTLG